MLIKRIEITDVFGKVLEIGDEIIIMTKRNYLIKGKIYKIDRSIQYLNYSYSKQDYNITDKSWSVLFTDGTMRNIYKI